MRIPIVVVDDPGCGWLGRSPPGHRRRLTPDSLAPRCAPWLGQLSPVGCGMSRGCESILFARNLFLPQDLGGNRYPFETMRRLGARGHPVTVVTPRLHGNFPALE